VIARLIKKGDQLLNGRLPCPVGCTKKGRAVLRVNPKQSRRCFAKNTAAFWKSNKCAASFPCILLVHSGSPSHVDIAELVGERGATN
jgi:hypothetical protein